jgi:hypothetical protein
VPIHLRRDEYDDEPDATRLPPGLLSRFFPNIQGVWPSGDDASMFVAVVHKDRSGALMLRRNIEHLRPLQGGRWIGANADLNDFCFATAESEVRGLTVPEELVEYQKGLTDPFILVQEGLRRDPPTALTLADTIREILHDERLEPRLVLDEDGVAFDFFAVPLENGGHERYGSLHMSNDGDLVAIVENRNNHAQDAVWSVMPDNYSIRDAIQRISAFLNA